MLPQLDSFDDVQCEEMYVNELDDTSNGELCYIAQDQFGPLVMTFDAKDIPFVAKMYHEHGFRLCDYYGALLDLLLAGF